MLRLSKEKEELSIVYDQIGTPTYASDIAKAILGIIKHPKFEDKEIGSNIYHYSNEGVCSWYDFAKTIFELKQITCNVVPIDTESYPTPAKRPYYGLISKLKIKNDFGLSISHWKDSLMECLKIF